MYTTTITVNLNYLNEEDVECIIDAESTSPKVAQKLTDPHMKAITCFSSFSVAISTMCKATGMDVEAVMKVLQATAKSGVIEVRDVRMVQKPTN